MNDTELDEMLDRWVAPPVGASLRRRVRIGFAQHPAGKAIPLSRAAFVPRAGKGLFAGAAVGAVLLLLAITQAFPQSLRLISSGFRIPYLVEYELIRYSDDGSPKVTARFTSFKHGGDQIMVALSDSDSPFTNAFQGIVKSVRLGLLQVAPSLIIPAESNETAARIRDDIANGCVNGAGDKVIGHEAMFGYPTTVIRSTSPDHVRTTQWLAPGLGCSALRLTNEQQRSDGTFRLMLRQQALSVTVRP